MAETPSNMLPLGTKAPNFTLLDTITNKMISLSDIKPNKAIVVMFLCNHCPYVKHIQVKLVEIAKTYQDKGVGFVAISSNDIENYPLDSPEKMREEAELNQYSFPYLYDETQQTAKNYQAACTPDFYIFDSDLNCIYRGRFDQSTPGNGKQVTGEDLSSALDATLAGTPVNQNQLPSVGCNIKWK